MGYRLRMHSEIRDWLSDLRGTEPELARLVGEAVLAILDAGESLGPPLVVPLESALGPPDDPREVLDYSYQRQLEAMQKIRRGVADVATSRKRVELQVGQLEQTAARLARQRQDALDAGHEDLASEAQTRAASVREQLSDLRQQHSSLQGEEQELTAASQRLQAKVDAFRIRKEMIKATYTAGQASRVIRDVLADIGEDAGDLEVTIAAAGTSAGSRAPGGPGIALPRRRCSRACGSGRRPSAARHDGAAARRARQRASAPAVRGGAAGHGSPGGAGRGSGPVT